jgi:hypothetical protein
MKVDGCFDSPGTKTEDPASGVIMASSFLPLPHLEWSIGHDRCQRETPFSITHYSIHTYRNRHDGVIMASSFLPLPHLERSTVANERLHSASPITVYIQESAFWRHHDVISQPPLSPRAVERPRPLPGTGRADTPSASPLRRAYPGHDTLPAERPQLETLGRVILAKVWEVETLARLSL